MKRLQQLLEQQPDLEVAREQLVKTLRAEGRLQEAEAVLNGPRVDLQ